MVTRKTTKHVIQTKRPSGWADISVASDKPLLAIHEVTKLRRGLNGEVRLVRRETIEQDIEVA